MVLDERSAGFVGLGLGLALGRPAVVVTTSGTAAAELHASVVEAHQAAVPLLVCTADRPPELQQVGAPQTIDQNRLYGSAVRFFADPGPPDASRAADWRSLASRVVLETFGPRPGPVQLNLQFREPLVGRPGPLPAGRPDGAPWHRRPGVTRGLTPDLVAELARQWSARRGVFVAGRGVGDPAALEALADRLGWPILAEPRSGCGSGHRNVVARADGFLREPTVAGALAPEVVVGVGEPPASKVLNQWLAGVDGDHVLVEPTGRVLDPDRRVGLFLEVGVAALRDGLIPAGDGARLRPGRPPAPDSAPQPAPAAWLEAWRAADGAAEAALDRALGEEPGATEPATARALLRAAGAGDAVVASSSMPVRDLEWYGPRRADVRVLANRGANGIDGVVSTALGVALAGSPTWLLVGDLALLHDAGGLLGCRDRPVRLRLVVADNAGGGIFSFLPQAHELPAAAFERYFGTPQAVDVRGLLAVHGIPTRRGHHRRRGRGRPRPAGGVDRAGAGAGGADGAGSQRGHPRPAQPRHGRGGAPGARRWAQELRSGAQSGRPSAAGARGCRWAGRPGQAADADGGEGARVDACDAGEQVVERASRCRRCGGTGSAAGGVGRCGRGRLAGSGPSRAGTPASRSSSARPDGRGGRWDGLAAGGGGRCGRVGRRPRDAGGRPGSRGPGRSAGRRRGRRARSRTGCRAGCRRWRARCGPGPRRPVGRMARAPAGGAARAPKGGQDPALVGQVVEVRAGQRPREGARDVLEVDETEPGVVRREQGPLAEAQHGDGDRSAGDVLQPGGEALSVMGGNDQLGDAAGRERGVDVTTQELGQADRAVRVATAPHDGSEALGADVGDPFDVLGLASRHPRS